MAERLTDEQIAIMTAIEANNTTIRQLRLTNEKLVALLPKKTGRSRGWIRDPRTGEKRHYKHYTEHQRGNKK